jgi:hypothetical protein
VRRVRFTIQSSITAATRDPARIAIYDGWETDQALFALRGSGPSDDQQTAISDADMKR